MSQYQIKIKEPCHENWNDMTAREQGRFCGVCTKEVVDFTSMDDEAVKSYFLTYKGSLCGRFNSTQLGQKDGRYFTLSDYTKKFIKAFALVFLMFTSIESYSQTMGKPMIKGKVAYSTTQNAMSKGIVFGADGAGIKDARIRFYKNEKFLLEIHTDGQGAYNTRLVKGSYSIIISKHGYKTFQTDITISNSGTFGDFELTVSNPKVDMPIMGDIQIMGAPRIIRPNK
jgi:hypothetical protein